jgi:hypothetical protein
LTETLLQLCTVVGQLVTQLSGSSPAETLAEASDALAEEIDEELGAGVNPGSLPPPVTGTRVPQPYAGVTRDSDGDVVPPPPTRKAPPPPWAATAGSQISSAGVTGVTVLPGPSPVTSNVHVTGARFYAVLVARGGQQPGIYRTYRRYAEAVAVPGSSPPGGGRQGPRANHLDFAPGTASHSFPTLGQARAWLEREGWVARYGIPVVEHW